MDSGADATNQINDDDVNDKSKDDSLDSACKFDSHVKVMQTDVVPLQLPLIA